MATQGMESRWQSDFFEQILGSKSKLDLVVTQYERQQEPFSWFATDGVVLRWINVPLWRVAWARQDQLRGLERWQNLIDQSRFARSNSWAALSERIVPSQLDEVSYWTGQIREEDKPSAWQRFRFLFSAGPFVISDVTIRKSLTAEAQQQMVIAAIAVRRFKMRTGKIPASLSVLVPDYLQKLPRDPMDGGVLRYRQVSDTEFLLYSVGTDGRDDGGNPALKADLVRYGQIWDGRDAVWPAPATPKNAEEAMQWTKD